MVKVNWGMVEDFLDEKEVPRLTDAGAMANSPCPNKPLPLVPPFLQTPTAHARLTLRPDHERAHFYGNILLLRHLRLACALFLVCVAVCR